MRIIIPVLLTFFGWTEMAQSQPVFNHPTSTSDSHDLVAGTYTYFDSGGATGDYSNNEDGTITFCPSADDEVVRVFFTEVSIELLNSGECQDILTVSGDVRNNNGDFCGDSNLDAVPPYNDLDPGMIFEGAPGGCLTFSFVSDASIALDGWRATIDVRALEPCACAFDCGRTLLCEGFENYASWPLSLQSDHWTKRDPGAADAVPEKGITPSGDQLLEIQQSGAMPQAALLLGDSTRERYRMSWIMRLEAGNDGRFTFYHNEAMNHEAFEVRMDKGSGEVYILDDPNTIAASFGYQENNWTSFMAIIDLDQDLAELWVEGQLVASWQFSRGRISGGGVSRLNQLGAILFSSGTLSYLDDLCFSVLNCEANACSDSQGCPVLVNGTRLDSQCEACCLGYTEAEWEEIQEMPRMIGLSEKREWVDQGTDITLQEIGGDSVLFVDSRAIDTLDFRPEDIVLSNYCSEGLAVTVDDQRPVAVDAYCFSFEVIWRVSDFGMPVDSFSLSVTVECNTPPGIDSITYRGNPLILKDGDTLRLNTCADFALSDFNVFTQGCQGTVEVEMERRNFQWVGDLPPGEQDDVPCFREELIFTASQCDVNGAATFLLYTEVNDGVGPLFQAPPEATVSCLSELGSLSKTGLPAMVEDGCGVIDTSYIDNVLVIEGCSAEVLRIWELTDSCGNVSSATQRILVQDEVPPSFVAPIQVTIECMDDLDNLELTGRVLFVSDNCEVMDTFYTDEITPIGDCTYSVRRSWTVEDRCGNRTTKEQLIQVADTQSPTFTVPAEVRVTEEQLDDLSFTGMVSDVADNCEIGDTTYSDSIFREATCREEGWMVRTWRITDGCGNFAEASQDIFYSLDVPDANAGPDRQISCTQPTVQLDATASSGGPEIVYEWQTDDGNILSGGATLQPLVDAAGTYTLTVRNTVSGCTSTDRVAVSRTNDLDPNVVGLTDVRCPGSATGVITINPQGGTPPYDIRWSNGMTINQLAGLRAGTYTVTVTDSGDCQATTSVTVESPDPINLEIEILEGSRCDTIPTGQAAVRVTGGTSPYRYIWDNGETTPIADSLAAGGHVLEVRDANDCPLALNFSVPEEIPAVNLDPLPVFCQGDLPFPLTGGAPAGGTYQGPGVGNSRFDPVAAGAGTHSIVYSYTAPNGCTDTAITSVTVHPQPELTDVKLAPVCVAEDTVRLDFVKPSGGVYAGAGISGRNILEPPVAGPGNFPVLYTYRDPRTGCSNSLATLLEIEPLAELSLEVEASDTVICENDVLELEVNVQNEGDAPTYAWMINGQLQTADTSFLLTSLPPGRYTIQGEVTTSINCATARTVMDSLTVRVDPITMEVNAPANDTLCSGADALMLEGGFPAGGTFSGAYVEEGVFQTKEAGAGIFTIAYTVPDTVTGCPVTETFELLVDICTSLDLPPGIQRLVVYPNPASAYLQVSVESDRPESVSLELWDSRGQRVFRQQQPSLFGSWSTRLDVSALPKGLYWLRLGGDGFQTWRRVVVQ